MDKKPKIVASDLNGTLTTGSPVLAVARWLAENQPRASLTLFKLKILLTYLQVKLGMREIDIWGEEAMGEVLGLVQSPTSEMLEDIMEYVVEQELWPKRRTAPLSRLNELFRAGATIFILSGAYQPAVEKFAKKMAPERVFGIGTPVAVVEDAIRMIGPLNSRERKLSNLRAVIGSQQLDTALGDTFADIPLLEQANCRIAVHPDRVLLEIAIARGWEVIP